MIVKIISSGKSFKGLSNYLLHDVKAESAERVAWTHTLNCAHDHAAAAVDEMFWTYRDAELLKQEAGVRAGGHRLENPLQHISLSWAPDETPTREQMIEAVEDYLKFRDISQHQALLVAHDDRPHPHVHIMLHAIDPETGLKMNTSFEKKVSQEWALQYEREHGKIYCEERLQPAGERDASPTREQWLAMKNAENDLEKSEAARRNFDRDYLERIENRRIIQSEEWKILKEFQRDEREAHFAAGKSEFIELRKEIYREIREEFRDEWAAFYKARKEGQDAEALATWRAEILEAQRTTLAERRDLACDELRTGRDDGYRSLLDGQKELRAELIARQEQGLSSPQLLDLVNYAASHAETECWLDENPFRQAAEEVFSREQPGEAERADEHDRDEQVLEFPWTPSGPTGVRPGLDIGGNVGLGFLGGLSVIGEHLFDGFFGDSPLPKRDEPPKIRAPRAEPEFPPHNPFTAFAEEARRQAERQQEESDRAWWDERRARYRD